MAQHHLVREEKEPKLFKELRRVVPTVNRQWHNLKEFKPVDVLGKTVTRLSVDYYPAGRAVGVGDFDLEDISWDETANGGLNFQKGATLEVHFNKSGIIKNVYYPL